MTEEQLEVCYSVNDCSICPYGKADTDFEGNFKGTYSCGTKESPDEIKIDGEQLYDPESGQTVGELESLTPEQLNNLLRKENNRDKEVITAERNCNDR